ncbi:NADP-dependent oxidoreductase RED1 [Fusarium oxysporum f. sp. albedinis]|nr:NADP-dependent oxidoreductase RED1 [Fusarium oxysporum f. sp. albedinis]
MLWLISNDDDVNSRSIPSSILLQANIYLRRWLCSRFLDRPYKMPFELVVKSSSEKVYRKELKRFKVTGHRLKKHQFRVLRELWVDDIWKSGEHVDVDPAAYKDGG